MKKNYFFAALLIFAIAANLNAQFRELEGKEPVFHLTFADDEVYDAPYYPGASKLISYGTERVNWRAWDSTWIENDTIRGHAWGGDGNFEVFTFEEQVVSSDNFEEVFGPTMWWPSWVSEPDRADGIAAYSDANGGYPGPCYDTPRTIAFYIMYTDSTIVDSELGRDGGAHRLYDVGTWTTEGGGGMIRWLVNPETMQFQFDWGGAGDYSEPNVFTKGEWTHLALTIPDGGARENIKLYVNGVPKSFVPDSASGAMTHAYTQPHASWDGFRICNVMNAWMADYRIYDVELTESDFKTLLGLNVAAPDLDQQDLFNIYPVPNHGVFTVDINDSGVRKIVITNTLGQVVHDQIVDQKETINLSHLSSGMYFVSLRDNNKNIQTKKVLIK